MCLRGLNFSRLQAKETFYSYPLDYNHHNTQNLIQKDVKDTNNSKRIHL